MSAESVLIVVGAHHHRHRVPSHQGADTALHEQIARHGPLILRRDGVAKRCRNGAGQRDAGALRVLGEVPE